MLEHSAALGNSSHCADRRIDVLLVGGGLANSLIALRLKAMRSSLRIVMLERDRDRGASHTWSFFRTDVTAEVWSWLAPLAAYRWGGYDVMFPAHARTIGTEYASLTSDKLRDRVEEGLGVDLQRGVDAGEVGPARVKTTDGRTLEAPLVIDGRGARPSRSLALAWQKFVGLELRLDAPHGLSRPVVMDATVEQRDGFRFLYLLPLSADVLLVEDTRYSDGAELDLDDLQAQVLAYVGRRGWSVAQVVRRESGVLPVVLGGDIDAFWTETDVGTPQSGLRAALFHPTTGYSLPEAAGLAQTVASAPDLSSRAVRAMVEARSKALWRRQAFFRILNRMMFLAAQPDRRYRVLERFYRLSPALIERFYAGRLTLSDCARILIGEPPVPIGRALAALPARAAHDRSLGA